MDLAFHPILLTTYLPFQFDNLLYLYYHFCLGCIGSQPSCCGKVELFPQDRLELIAGTRDVGNIGIWCEQVVIARDDRREDYECTGCTLNVRFTAPDNPAYSVYLLETNYSRNSVLRSESLELRPLVSLRVLENFCSYT